MQNEQDLEKQLRIMVQRLFDNIVPEPYGIEEILDTDLLDIMYKATLIGFQYGVDSASGIYKPTTKTTVATAEDPARDELDGMANQFMKNKD